SILQFFLPASWSVGLPQDFFSQSDRLRRDFHQFVIGNPFDSFFESHFTVRRNNDVLVPPGSANIGQLFLAADVDIQVDVAGILPDHHAFINPRARRYENHAALLEMKNRVRSRLTFSIRYHGAIASALNRAVPRCPAVEQGIHDSGAAGIGEKARAKTDQAARRNAALEPDPARARVDHFGHLALAHGEQL